MENAVIRPYDSPNSLINLLHVYYCQSVKYNSVVFFKNVLHKNTVKKVKSVYTVRLCNTLKTDIILSSRAVFTVKITSIHMIKFMKTQFIFKWCCMAFSHWLFNITRWQPPVDVWLSQMAMSTCFNIGWHLINI